MRAYLRPLTLVLLCCLYGTPVSHADGPGVVLLNPVTYSADASIVQKVKTECRPDDLVARQVTAALNKHFGGGSPVSSVDGVAAGQVMSIRISHVLGVGGGGWSGPKAITVYVDLYEHGKVVRSTRVNRWSTGGFFGGFRGTCSILDRCAKAIAKDLTAWAADPAFKIIDEPAPKGAPPEASAPTTSAQK